MANYAPKWKIDVAGHLIRSGISKRRAASIVGLSKQTVFTHLGHIKSECPCGLPSGHKQWCNYLINQSERRQLYLSEGLCGDKTIPSVYPIRKCPKCKKPIEKAIRHIWCWQGRPKPKKVPRVYKYDAMGRALSFTSNLGSCENFSLENVVEQTMFSDPLSALIQDETVAGVVSRLIDEGMSRDDAVALVRQYVDV